MQFQEKLHHRRHGLRDQCTRENDIVSAAQKQIDLAVSGAFDFCGQRKHTQTRHRQRRNVAECNQHLMRHCAERKLQLAHDRAHDQVHRRNDQDRKCAGRVVTVAGPHQHHHNTKRDSEDRRAFCHHSDSPSRLPVFCILSYTKKIFSSRGKKGLTNENFPV